MQPLALHDVFSLNVIYIFNKTSSDYMPGNAGIWKLHVVSVWRSG